MNSSPALNDEQWLKLLEQVAKNYNEVTLSRGFHYFKQKFVATLSISENRVVQAKVTGSEVYKVTLHLDKLGSSSCTCPVHTSCKHLAAVMMELADRLGYPASQMVNAKHYLKRTTSTSTSESLLKQLPNLDAAGWHEFLNQSASDVKPSYDLRIYAEELRNQLQYFRKSSIPFSAMDRIYFDLHQELFILRKVFEHNAQSQVTYYTSSVLYRMFDEVHVWLQSKSALFDFTLSEERLRQTLRYLRQQMAEETGYKYLNYGLYTAMWKNWIMPHSEADQWLSQEIDDIEKQTTDSIAASLSATKAFLYLHQSNSQEAWRALNEGGTLNKAPTSLFLPFLSHLSDSLDWSNLVEWLLRTASYFNGQRTKDLEVYVGYWKKAVEHLPEAEQHMWSVLEGTLPQSSKIIEDMLYERREWKLWVEMQMVQGHDPLYHRVSVLQPIEKEAPGYLLPYYHQAITHYVALKNRQDYKVAVKLLKRLEKVYKKMKQAERWGSFIVGFIERHSRLRALQEELKKGKLLE